MQKCRLQNGGYSYLSKKLKSLPDQYDPKKRHVFATKKVKVDLDVTFFWGPKNLRDEEKVCRMNAGRRAPSKTPFLRRGRKNGSKGNLFVKMARFLDRRNDFATK